MSKTLIDFLLADTLSRMFPLYEGLSGKESRLSVFDTFLIFVLFASAVSLYDCKYLHQRSRKQER